MRRLVTMFISSLFTILAVGAAAGPALAAGSYYQAQLATPPAAQRLVVREVVWNCGPAGCTAGKSNSLARTDCAALAREAGPVRSFTVAGRALGAAELEKCNAHAR